MSCIPAPLVIIWPQQFHGARLYPSGIHEYEGNQTFVFQELRWAGAQKSKTCFCLLSASANSATVPVLIWVIAGWGNDADGCCPSGPSAQEWLLQRGRTMALKGQGHYSIRVAVNWTYSSVAGRGGGARNRRGGPLVGQLPYPSWDSVFLLGNPFNICRESVLGIFFLDVQ